MTVFLMTTFTGNCHRVIVRNDGCRPRAGQAEWKRGGDKEYWKVRGASRNCHGVLITETKRQSLTFLGRVARSINPDICHNASKRPQTMLPKHSQSSPGKPPTPGTRPKHARNTFGTHPKHTHKPPEHFLNSPESPLDLF